MKKKNTIRHHILNIIFALVVIIPIYLVISARGNYGVAKVFSYSSLEILTDSMEPTLKVGSGIVIKDVDINTLKAKSDDYDGDIICFYRKSLNILVTHRIVNIHYEGDKVKYFECFGDNLHSTQCNNNDCTNYPHDIVKPEYVLGKVVKIDDNLGKLLHVINNKVFILMLFVGAVFIYMLTLLFDRKEKISNEK